MMPEEAARVTAASAEEEAERREGAEPIYRWEDVRELLLARERAIVIVDDHRDADCLLSMGAAGVYIPRDSIADAGALHRLRHRIMTTAVIDRGDDRAYTDGVAAVCHALGSRVVSIPGGLADWLGGEHTLAQLRDRIREAPLWEPPPPLPPPEDPQVDEESVIQRMDRIRIQREAIRRLDAEARGPVPEPVIISLGELPAPQTAIPWRIDGWQPVGSRVMLTGRAKSGKTTLVGGLVRSLVDGNPWLGAAPVHPVEGTVAILDAEMSAEQTHRWLRDQGIAHPDRVIIVSLRGQPGSLDLLDPGCRARWAARLRAQRVRYLIVDCLRPILDALGLDESRDAGRWFVALDALLHEADIPEACIIHHMGHAGERARGDSRLRDWPDVEWRLVREDDTRDDSARYIAAYGRDVDVSEARLAYEATTRRLRLAGGSRDERRRDADLTEVLAALGDRVLSGRGLIDAVQARGVVRDAARIRAACIEGARRGEIHREAGPGRAVLHRRASGGREGSPVH